MAGGSAFLRRAQSLKTHLQNKVSPSCVITCFTSYGASALFPDGRICLCFYRET